VALACTEATEHVAIELPLEPKSAARARAMVSSLPADAEGSALDDSRIMVSELVADALAIEPRSPEAVITVEAQVLDGTTWVTVAFAGLAVPVPADKPQPAGPGWGIHLVKTLATRWGIQVADGSTFVWFEA
jgi:hypothetical protein